PNGEQALADLCASAQRAIVEILVRKSVAACERRGVSNLVLAGGVAANRGLRQRAAEACSESGLMLHVPAVRACTDNAAMIAFRGVLAFKANPDATPSDLGSVSVMKAYSRDPSRRRGS